VAFLLSRIIYSADEINMEKTENVLSIPKKLDKPELGSIL